jgi:signal transduction histidine kinase
LPERTNEVTDEEQTTVDVLEAAELAGITEEVASVLRHDLRNKLAAIRNAAFYIRRRLAETEAWRADPRLEELSGVIQSEATRANELIDERLGLLHLFARAVERTDARECLRRAVTCARIQREPALRVDIEAEPGDIDADPIEVALAVRCLLENAAEAMNGHGAIEVRGFQRDSHYVVEVADRGPGIAQQERDVVLKPFHTTKQGHAGLGLNIAARVAQRCRGRVVVGEPPLGALVALHLQLAEPRA